MRFVFADAGYWIAVLDTDDVLHQTALDVSEALGAVRIITTDMVLAEVASHFAAYGSSYRRAVTLLINDLKQAEDAEVVPQPPPQFDAAFLLCPVCRQRMEPCGLRLVPGHGRARHLRSLGL